MKRGFILVLFFMLISLSGFVMADISTTSVPSSSDNILTSQISVPQNLQIPARILFGLSIDNSINLQEFVVLIVLWLVILLIVRQAVSFLFGDNWKSLGIAIVVTCLISVSGALSQMTYYIVGVIIGKSIVYWVIFIMALLIIGVVVVLLLKKLRNTTNTLVNEEVGMKIGSK